MSETARIGHRSPPRSVPMIPPPPQPWGDPLSAAVAESRKALLERIDPPALRVTLYRLDPMLVSLTPLEAG